MEKNAVLGWLVAPSCGSGSGSTPAPAGSAPAGSAPAGSAPARAGRSGSGRLSPARALLGWHSEGSL